MRQNRKRNTISDCKANGSRLQSKAASLPPDWRCSLTTSCYDSVLKVDNSFPNKNLNECVSGSSSHLLQEIDDHYGGVNCLALSEDRSLLVSGGEDGVVRLWSTFSLPCECIGVLIGHTDYITCCTVYHYMVISGSADCTLRMWNIQDGSCLMKFLGHQAFINQCHTYGPILLSTSFDNTARVWTLTEQLIIVTNGQQSVKSNPNFKDPKGIKEHNGDILNVVSKTKVCTSFGQCLYVLEGHRKSVTQVVIMNTDSNKLLKQGIIQELDLIITTSTDATVRIYNLATGELRHVLLGHQGPINCLVTDNNEIRFFYTAGADSVIKHWNVITGELIQDLSGHKESVLCLLSHNRILYSGSMDRTVRAWAMEFGQCTRIYYHNTAPVNCLQYFKGILYTGGNDYNARLYDSNSGVLKQTFAGHCGPISALQVVPGKLFTSSSDGRILVWDCSDAQTIPSGNIKMRVDTNTKSAKELFLMTIIDASTTSMSFHSMANNQHNKDDLCLSKQKDRKRSTSDYKLSHLLRVELDSDFSLNNYEDNDGCLQFLSYYCCWPTLIGYWSSKWKHKSRNSMSKSNIEHRDKYGNKEWSENRKQGWGEQVTEHCDCDRQSHKEGDARSTDMADVDSDSVRRAIQALEPYLRSFQ